MHRLWTFPHSVAYRSRRLLVTTVTLDRAMAADASMGESRPSAATGTPAKDAIPENRLHFFARSGGFGAAQQALAKFQEAVEHFLAASGFQIAPQSIAELFESARL